MDFGDFNVYHIFTMGFAGAEEYQEQCGQPEHRLWKIENLLEYLKDAGYQLEKIVVERNLEIIPRDQLENVVIQENDSIEVLSFVGGG